MATFNATPLPKKYTEVEMQARVAAAVAAEREACAQLADQHQAECLRDSCCVAEVRARSEPATP